MIPDSIEVKMKVTAAIGADQQAGKHIVFSIVGAALTDFATFLLHLLIDSPLDDRLMDILEHHPILTVIVDPLLILVPEIPDGGRRGGKEEFDGADGQPEYAQRRRSRQIPPHLRLDNALPERNAPPRRKPNINEAPQQRHRQKIHRAPMSARNDPRGHSADDQKRRKAAGQDLPFFSAPSQNHLPEWVSVCKAYHTEEAIARKAAISIPLARFSGIGIAMQDPIWYTGQEENWKNRGLGKEWAA